MRKKLVAMLILAMTGTMFLGGCGSDGGSGSGGGDGKSGGYAKGKYKLFIWVYGNYKLSDFSKSRSSCFFCSR